MQQPSSLPYYYPPLYNQDGNNQWFQDPAKTSQFQPPCDNSSPAFHVNVAGFAGNPNNFGPLAGQVSSGGGGQSRVQVGPQQPQPPSQPTPTSTPPSIHGDMNKQTLLQNQQQSQMNFIPSRTPMQPYPTFAPRAMAQSQQIRTHGGRTQLVAANYMSIPGMLTQTPTQAIVQTVPYHPSMQMYSQPPRQGAPPGTYTQSLYAVQQAAANYYPHTTQQYFPGPQVIPQPQYQGMSSGGPSPQAGNQQAPPVQMMRPVGGQTLPPAKHEAKKRPNAIKIIDPTTNDEVVLEDVGNNNNITPTRSNDSSARETPQPNAGVSIPDNTVAADFAARVARVATEAQDHSDQVQDSISSDSDVHHKQQPNVVPSEKAFTTNLSTSSEEFIPRSHKPVQMCEPTIEEQRIPDVPTVSAETNSPAIDIQRPKEQFPALIKAAPSAPAIQSPPKVNAKKQKGLENNERQQQANSVSLPAQVPPPVPDNKESNVTSKKGGGKVSQKEETVSMPPKEKKDKSRSVSKEQSPAPSSIVPPIVSSQVDVVVAPVKPSAPPTTVVSVVKEVAKNNSSVASISLPTEEAPAAQSSKPQQQQNGELPMPAEPPQVSVEGNKPTQRKKGKNNKMRDLNRKGADKEGSEMEAFMTEPIVNEDKERPSTPISPPPVPVKAPLPPFAQPAEPSHEDKIQEDLEEKEDKLLVEARNEENAKVSALNKADEEPAPVIEKTVPQLTLKRSYKKDQWSPLNQEGKKKYDRDFLLDLKNEPQSQLKPDNLPDVVTVIRENLARSGANMNFMVNNYDRNVIMPSYSQRNSQNRGPLPTKRSQGGNSQKGGPKNTKIIHMSLSLHEDVKLKTVENAWKPGRINAEGELSQEDKDTEEVYKNVRGILNKLTPQKFETLMQKFLQIPINSEKRLIGVIDLVFEKAVDEPNFSKAYANMCKVCSKIEVTKVEEGKTEKVNFRKLLISKCQQEFEKNKLDVLDSDQEEINNCTNPEKKKELQLAFDEKERLIRRKSVGNIRFIGELFKLGMLTQNIMYRCIEQLLQDPQEESLECLCKLLTTIGRDLEFGSQNNPQNKPVNPQALNPYFSRMNDLAQRKDATKVSSRVRFMLQDVIDLRLNKWIPRREDNNPKTIEQINKEAERESLEMSYNLREPPPRMNRGNDRQDDRRKVNRANNNNQNEEGWNTVGSRNYKYNAPSFDSSKILKPELGDISTMNLGGSSAYRFPNTGAKNTDNKTNFSTTNVFSALSKVDDRKPMMGSSNKRLNPPSMERERMRMIHGVENDRQSSRGSSVHRDRPSSQPPSRDSSIPRQVPDNKEADKVKSKHEERGPMDEMSQEKWERQVTTIVDEYFNDLCSLEETKQDIEQLPRSRIGDLIEKAIQITLEKKLGAQRKIGVLITALMDSDVITPDILVAQLGNIYEIADDIAIDVPKVWELQAFIIVPILAAGKINFSHFKSACSAVLKTDSAAKLLVPVLTVLAQEKGNAYARRVWDSSNVSLLDFLPSNVDVDAFIKEKSLDYLIGEPPKYECQATMDQVHKDLLKLIKENQPFEIILDFISANVGDKVKDLHFIRALITAICEACISDSNYVVDEAKFKPYEKLIQRYVDNNEDRELASLDAVHNFVVRLEHPQGLLKAIFNLFWENSLISLESFLKWREVENKLEHKGVSLMTLTSFFMALEEAESDDENS